ncbi:Ferritin superfamily protein [Halalkaliarchaeum sp. AArc-CO]|uniref:ferritin family protein n=1 Tax=Halalkaliarchaeum sp. AArc-CO TaxID=2866381 RepID=UPI00217DE548|nr:ferritin family protein [Halalkaliarchaeum sp. AArc-CO]UWG52151.1 Ferritin superfamily protein [Halalkaliarchaeum sp. AArc-CO]
MSVGAVSSDRQLARLLQLGIVLEEVVEARAYHHYRSLDAELDEEVEALLEEAAEESAEHRDRLEKLVEQLGVESVPFEEVESLVEAQYGKTKPEDFDGVLYDQLCNEETAYKFYDDLIAAIEDSDARFSVDRETLLETLREIQAEEAEGVEEVTELMERSGSGGSLET